MKPLLILSLALVLSVQSGLAGSKNVSVEDIDTIRKSLVEAITDTHDLPEEIVNNCIVYSDSGRANDVLLLQLYMSVALPDREVERLLSLCTEDGAFADIDYSDKTRGRWNPTLHLTRMYALAKLYANPESRWYHDAEMSQALHRGIKFWGVNRPICPNWWHNDIGVPKKLTAVLLMMFDELSEEEIAIGLKVLENSAFGRTGQNKAWLAGNQLMKGILIKDEQLILKAREQLLEEIAISEEEGLKADWSFHQHGPQVQFGNYGLTYIEHLSFWMRTLDGSKYAFPDEANDILASFLKEGINWTIWKGMMDPSYCGRQVFINGGKGKAYAASFASLNIANCNREDKESFREMAMSNFLPLEYASHLTGAKYFEFSDCGIYRTKDWYSSIRMHSTRTVGFEFTNRENLNAWFSADGALLFMADASEYENIFACWDWKKLPGVTSYDDGQELPTNDNPAAKQNNSAHVGGLTWNNAVMATTMEINRGGLHAFKSDFFFDDLVIALGSDISIGKTSDIRLTTGIDQNYHKSKVKTGRRNSWAWHNGKGYVILDEGRMEVETGMQKGKWDLIDPFYQDQWQEEDIFKCYIEHDPQKKDNTYAYAVLPVCKKSQVRAFAGTGLWASIKKIFCRNSSKGGVEIVGNTAEYQAIAYKGVLCVVVHQACSLTYQGKTFQFDRPCILITDFKDTVETELPL